MRVKLVVISKIAGASDNTVIRMMICMAAEKFSRLVRSGSLVSMDGIGRSVLSDELIAELMEVEDESLAAKAGDGRTSRTKSAQTTLIRGLTRASFLIDCPDAALYNM